MEFTNSKPNPETQGVVTIESNGALPIVDEKDGIYTDDETGERYASAETVTANLPIKKSPLWVRSNISSIPGVGLNNQKARLFNLDEAKNLLEIALDLPQVDSISGLVEDHETLYGSITTIASIIQKSDSWLKSRVVNELSIDGLDKHGNKTKLYPLDYYKNLAEDDSKLHTVNPESRIAAVDGKRYATLGTMRSLLGKSQAWLETRAKESVGLPGIDVTGRKATLYSVDYFEHLIEIEGNGRISVNPETGLAIEDGKRYATLETVSKQIGRAENWLKIRKSRIEILPGIDRLGRITELYCIDDVEKIIESEQEGRISVDPETGIALVDGTRYATIKTLESLTDKSAPWFNARLNKLKSLPGIDRQGRPATLYCVDDVEDIMNLSMGMARVDSETGEALIGGNSYTTRRKLESLISKSSKWIENRKDQIRTLPGFDGNGREVELYCIKDVENLVKLEGEGVITVDSETGIGHLDGLSYASIRTLSTYLEKPVYWIKARQDLVRYVPGIGTNHRPSNLYCIEDFEELRVNEAANKINNPTAEFNDFTAENDVQECYKLFGSLSHSDILILFGKEKFKTIPSDQISKIIRESLGDTLLEGVPLSDIVKFKDIFKRIDDLDPEVQGRMADYLIETVVKGGVIELYGKNHERYEEPIEFKDEIFAYLDDLSSKADSKFLSEALTKFKQEFAQMVSFERPSNMVESVSGNRHFPDFYQLINVSEIAEKHRMLIADQMGMGKSASAILSKESLTEQNKCGAALVVVPSNILESGTWQNYLSDKIDEDGKQVGYFKKGEAPKVLIVTNPGDLNNPSVTKDYDYVLISQERLNSNYMPGLMEMDFDMLISDEVHKLKKPNGVLSKNLLKLGEKFTDEDKYMILLSGTPVPNKVRDIAVSMKLLRSDVPDIKEATISQLSSQIIEGSVDVVGMSEIRGYLMSHMQMKRMTKEIVGHEAEEEDIPANLTKAEQELFELIREDDELTSSQKIQLMQQLTLNPQLIDPEFSGKGAKAVQLEERLRKRFDDGAKKIVVFVNQYVSGVIRDGGSSGSEFMSGDVETIIDQLNLKDRFRAEILTIHGDVSGQERKDAQEKINSGNEKTIVLVGGQTADVGIDFSGASGVIFYNRPWSNYDKSQQAGRVYRPGLKHDIFIDTLTTGPFERGMAEYVDSKERVIEKMLKGIPLSELERDLIKTDEVRVSDDVELSDISLGEIRHLDEYQSAPQKLNPYLATAKRIGSEEKFREVFEGTEHGEEYARLYALCSDKGYQPNNNRLVANLIQEEIKEAGKKPAQVAVLDLASGPRMLRRYSPEGLKTQVVSEDILRGHFLEEDIGKNAFVGSFKETKWPAHTFEFVTLLEAFHQTGYVPGRGNFERVEVLSEINRVLELGGKAYINILYSMGLKDKEGFSKAISELGFKVVESQTGQYSSGKNFETTLIVLEKTKDLPVINLGDQEKPKARPDTATLVKTLKEKGFTEGLKLEVSKKYLGDTNVIMDTVEMPGGRKMKLNLTENDQRVKAIRDKLQSDAEKLVIGHLKIDSIPKEEIERSHFKRCILGGKYVLYHKMPGDSGFFIYRQ